MKDGQWYRRDDGATLRVDYVGEHWVCFRSWGPKQIRGCALKLAPDEFAAALAEHGMAACDEEAAR